MVSAAPDACSCFVVAERDRALPARVVDLSPDGIRLALKGWVEPGTILGIEWQSRAGRTPCFLLAVIQGIAAQSGGGWVAIGRFARKLNPDACHLLP